MSTANSQAMKIIKDQVCYNDKIGNSTTTEYIKLLRASTTITMFVLLPAVYSEYSTDAEWH